MKKELCYRVEDSNGLGMYSIGKFQDALNNLCRDIGHDHWVSTNCHPAPSIDEKLNWTKYSSKGWLFGFHTMDQLNRWIFDIDVIQKMIEYDLAVSVYECKQYSIGDTQMIFDRKTAKFIERFVLTP